MVGGRGSGWQGAARAAEAGRERKMEVASWVEKERERGRERERERERGAFVYDLYRDIRGNKGKRREEGDTVWEEEDKSPTKPELSQEGKEGKR